MKRFVQFAALGVGTAVLLATGGCSSGPEPAEPAVKQEAKAAEPVTGQTALFEMYKVARSWAPDLQILEVNSMLLEDKKADPGKAYAWTAAFYSPEKGVSRAFSYSVEEFSQTLHQGVRAGAEEPFRPATARTKPFLVNAVQVDSPDAYKTAAAEGRDYASAHKDLPVTFILEQPEKFNLPAWRVVWGASVGVSNFSIYIDASTGKYVQTMR